MSKIYLSEGKLKGGLNQLDHQLYKINYLPKEKEMCDKIEIAILLSGDGKEYAYRSIRFNSPAELKGFTMEIIKALFYFMKARKQIVAENFHYKLQKFIQDANMVIKEVFR